MLCAVSATLSRMLEPKPLIAAAIIGALAYALIHRSHRAPTGLALGAAIGVAVQLGVRGIAVS